MPTKGFKQAADRMRIRAQTLSNPRTYQQVSQIVQQSIVKNFEAGGRQPQWPKRTKDYAWPILQKTGAMRQKAEQTTSNWQHQDKQHRLRIMGPHYGPYHQHGPYHQQDTSKRVMRKYVKLLQNEIQQVLKIFQGVLHGNHH